MRQHPGVAFRVEPSPSGGYLVRMEGVDRPVGRFDTEDEAEEWVARHAPPTPPTAPPRRSARFTGLADGTQLIVRAPAAGDPPQTGGALAVAVDPPTGVVVGAVGGAEDWVAPGWSTRGVAAALRAAL